ncbi:UDP-N-acetylmuramate--L-alanine ligase, partial [bacterium]
SDGSFLLLAPTIAVITNIDREHINHYGTEEAIERAFIDFANKVPFYGAVILCLDDPKVQGILPALKRRTITYGLGRQADLFARHIVMREGKSSFEVVRNGEPIARVSLSLPGQHNVLNALAAFCVGLELGASPEVIAKSLGEFGGVDRRSQVKGTAGGVMVMDDYGHHPTEIEAALKGLRESWDRRIIAIFQPHRYSRTQDLAERFYTAFYNADCLFVADVYAAGESPLDGVDSQALVEGIRQHGHRFARYAGTVEEAAALAAAEAKDGDIVITLGAGNVWQASEKILTLLRGEDS